MSQWNARMPRKSPPAGKASFVLAIKRAGGARMELCGDLPDAQALALWRLAGVTPAVWALQEGSRSGVAPNVRHKRETPDE